MVRKITINGEEYYEVYDPATNKVSDIFQRLERYSSPHS